MELRISNISKNYGDKKALNPITITLEPGVTGLLGANGAGKTTFMRMICGILKPTTGSIQLDGIDRTSEDYRMSLGYLPQDFGYCPDFTGEEFLQYIAALKGLSNASSKRRCNELIALVGLEDKARKKIKTYSGGMKQRLGIAQALINKPKILVLDEPTAGLDPKERVRFRNLIATLGNESIVLLSTHIVSDIEQIANRILVMNEGTLLFDGKANAIENNLEEFFLNLLEDE